MKDKLIIFDMDNTLLRSRIDFPKMRQAVYALLDQQGVPQYRRNSTANTILAYTASPDRDPAVEAEMWRQVAIIENEGLEHSVLEPWALEALDILGKDCELAVLTNNTDFNLAENLGRLGLLPYLSCVAGRDSVPRLKPAPDGLQWVAAHYPWVPAARVMTVGDAMNDAQAAQAAGYGFVAYNNSRQEDWRPLETPPLLKLTAWDPAACAALLSLWENNYGHVSHQTGGQ